MKEAKRGPKPTDMPKSCWVPGLKHAGEGINPKDRIGATKPDMTLIPTTALAELALALDDGAYKYGPYNWRVESVQIRTYLAAAKRHIDAFLEGEHRDAKSNTHHLGNAMACCAIIIDAMAVGKAIDNRPLLSDSARKYCLQVGTVLDSIQEERRGLKEALNMGDEGDV